MNLFSRIVTVPVLALCASLSFAGDDIDFAKALARDGFGAEAEEVCKRIEAGKNAAEKAALPLVRAEIAARKAATAGTLAEARAELAKGAASLDAFVAANPGHEREAEARLQAGIMRRQEGELAEQEGTAKAGEEARPELEAAVKGLAEAKKVAAARKENIEAKAGGKRTKELDEAEGQVAEADYQAARCLHLRSRIEPNADEKKKWLAKALDAFSEMEWSYNSDSGLMQEASLTWALVLRDLGRPKEALTRYELAWKVTAPWREKVATGPLGPWEREVAERAMAGRAETLRLMGDAAGALESIEALLKLVPDASKDRSGFLALLEKGAALAALGRGGDAAKLAQELADKAGSPAMRDMAAKKLIEWGRGTAGARRMLADAAYEAGKWEDALKAYREVMAAGEGEDGDVMWRVAVCTDRCDKAREAALLYETVAKEFPALKEAPAAAFRAAQIWNSLAAKAGDDGTWEREQTQKLLRMLTDRWPKDPNAQNAMYLVAEAAFERGEFERAATDFERVPEDANLRLQAVAMAGRAWQRLAEEKWKDASKRDQARVTFGVAEKRLREAVAAALKLRPEPGGPSGGWDRGKPVVAFAREHLSSLLLHEQKRRAGDAVVLLREAVSDDPNSCRLGALLVRACIADDAPDEASAVAGELFRKFPSDKSAARACRSAAEACDTAAEAGGPRTEGLRAAAVARYAEALDAGAVPAVDCPAVADRVFGLAMLLNKLGADASIDSVAGPLPRPDALRDAARGLRAIASPDSATEAKIGQALALSGDLAGAQQAFGAVAEDTRLVQNGKFDPAAIAGRAWLLAAYEELGFVNLATARKSDRPLGEYDAAYAVFANLANACTSASEPWWRAKVAVLVVLSERGRERDLDLAVLGLKDLLANYPALDEGKFGMKKKIDALREVLDRKAPRK